MRLFIITLLLLISTMLTTVVLVHYAKTSNEVIVSDSTAKYAFIVKSIGTGGFGTGFKTTYKENTFIITAAHVCRDNSFMEVDHRFVSKVLYLNKLADICILEDVDELIAHNLKLGENILENRRYDKRHGYGFDSYNWLIYRKYDVVVDSEYMEYGSQLRIRVFGEVFSGNSGGPIIDNRGYLVGVAILSQMTSKKIPKAVLSHAINVKNTIEEYINGNEEMTEEEYILSLRHAPILINPFVSEEELIITDTDLKVYENAKRTCWNSTYGFISVFIKEGNGHYNVSCGRDR